MAYRSADEIAELFYERLKDNTPRNDGDVVVRKGNLTKRQAKWLSEVWFRSHQGEVTEKRFGGKGAFVRGDFYCAWVLWLFPNGGGILEVRETLNT
jgi:hypothetical protein